MKCRVLYVNAEEKKLKLTLNVDADLERKSLQEDDQKATLKPFQVGILFVSLCEKLSLEGEVKVKLRFSAPSAGIAEIAKR